MDMSTENQNNLEDRMFDFLELSQKIRTILSHENAILETCGCLNFESYLKQKSILLQNYEEKAEALCRDIVSNAGTDKTVHSLLIEEIIAVKKTLSDNTLKQFHSMEKTLQSPSGENSWH